jgi:hypothetical protein
MTERTLRDVDFRNPAAPEHATRDVFDRMFQRGPEVAADGGEAGAAERREEDVEAAEERQAEGAKPVEEQTMKDVDQTPPDEDASANRVWERGGEPSVDDEDEDADE